MATKPQQRKIGLASQANTIALFTLIVLVVSLGFNIWWQLFQKHRYEGQFAVIESSLRLLTATVAPQLLKAVDDNLRAVVSESPTQPSQTSTALAKIETDTASLRKLKAKLPDQQVMQSAALLEKVVKRYPDNPYAWGAAAQMVSYRSELRSEPSPRPDCYRTQGDGKWNGGTIIRYHDCTLDISNVAGFFAVEPRILQQGQPFDQGLRFEVTVELVNGTVSYSGGQMIQIIKLVCQNCSFDFSSPEAIPPPAGRSLAQQLLVADLNDVSIDVPVA